jgi:hypothetical protein
VCNTVLVNPLVVSHLFHKSEIFYLLGAVVGTQSTGETGPEINLILGKEYPCNVSPGRIPGHQPFGADAGTKAALITTGNTHYFLPLKNELT